MYAYLFQGYYTLDTKCEYQAAKSYFETAVLQRQEELAWCECGVIWPTLPESSGGTGFGTLSDELSGNCTLILTRCPLLIT